MGDIVNLRRVRKARDRKADTAQAAANRTAFGRTKGERVTAAKELARGERALDGAKRDDG